MKKPSIDNRDHYYKLAKEQGYRARSAFKLLQLNDEYDFLNQSVMNAVDLCAAPGSWSQVLSKMIFSSDRKGTQNRKVVAVDLQSMLPIPNVINIKGDITKLETVNDILDQFNNGQEGKEDNILADLVVCDGAPDVTGLHEIDEYLQSQLLMAALNITTFILKPGGSFVSKIFLDKDSDFLYARFKVFFEMVIFSKPKSSRQNSKENFIVCKGFQLPKDFQPRLINSVIDENLTSSETDSLVFPFINTGDLSGFD